MIKNEIAAVKLLQMAFADDAESLELSINSETNFYEQLDKALDAISECEMIITGCKDREVSLKNRRDAAQAKIDRLKNNVFEALNLVDMKSIKRPVATISVMTTPQTLVIVDENKIPEKFWTKPAPKLNRSELLMAAKTGGVPGVALSNGGETLAIRKT